MNSDITETVFFNQFTVTEELSFGDSNTLCILNVDLLWKEWFPLETTKYGHSVTRIKENI